jgi:hypothetical protein
MMSCKHRRIEEEMVSAWKLTLILGLVFRKGSCLALVPVPSLSAMTTSAWPATRVRSGSLLMCGASSAEEGVSKWAVVRRDQRPPVYDAARLAQADLEAESDIQFYRAGGPGGQHQASDASSRFPLICSGEMTGR